MKKITYASGVAIITTAFLLAQTLISIPGIVNRASAAQNCLPNPFFGTVTVDGVATDGVTVTLTDLTNAAPPLTATTSGGGLYLIESANLTVCAAAGDQIRLAASLGASGADTAVPYSVQASTRIDLSISAVPTPVLTSIAVTAPANKLSYVVGEILDITGLVVTGTYSDSSTQVEPVTAADITGFDSSAAAIGQILIITIGAQTTTYAVDIAAGPVPGIPPTVSNVAVIGRTNTGATITWTASAPSTGRVYFDRNRNKLTRARQATRRTIATTTDGLNYTAVITGLDPNKRYFFQVTATADQVSEPTAMMEFRTAK